MDYSTLDLAALRALPAHTLPSSYHLQQDPGNGCFGDPPGYPTYFTRAVYTRHGNTPPKGPQTVITDPEGTHRVVDHSDDWKKAGQTWEGVSALRDARLRKLYRPLPVDHPRVQAWISSVMQHTAHCYIDDAGLVAKREGDRSDMFVFPVPSYVLKTFVDDARFSDEWRTKERAAVEQHNAEIRNAAAHIATVNNHAGVRRIRALYPEWTPAYDAECRPLDYKGGERSDWWEREAVRPTPEQCAATSAGRRDYQKHRSGWCQFCGHVTPDTDGAEVRS